LAGSTNSASAPTSFRPHAAPRYDMKPRIQCALTRWIRGFSPFGAVRARMRVRRV